MKKRGKGMALTAFAMAVLVFAGCQGQSISSSISSIMGGQSASEGSSIVTSSESELSVTVFDEKSAGMPLDGYLRVETYGESYIAFSDGVLVNRGADTPAHDGRSNNGIYIPPSKQCAYFLGECDEGQNARYRYADRRVTVALNNLKVFAFVANPQYFFAADESTLYRYSAADDQLEMVCAAPSEFVISPSGESILYRLGNTLYSQTVGNNSIRLAGNLDEMGEEVVLQSVSDDGSMASVRYTGAEGQTFCAYVTDASSVQADEFCPDLNPVSAPYIYSNFDGSELLMSFANSNEIVIYNKANGWQEIHIEIGEREIFAGELFTGEYRQSDSAANSGYSARMVRPISHFDGCFVRYHGSGDDYNFYVPHGLLYYPFDGSGVREISDGSIGDIFLTADGAIATIDGAIYNISLTGNGPRTELLFASDGYASYLPYGDNPLNFYATTSIYGGDRNLFHIQNGVQSKMDLPGSLAYSVHEYDGFREVSLSPSGDGILFFAHDVATDTFGKKDVTGYFMFEGNIVCSFDETIPGVNSGEMLWKYSVMDDGRFFYSKNEGYFGRPDQKAQIWFFNGVELISVLDTFL